MTMTRMNRVLTLVVTVGFLMPPALPTAQQHEHGQEITPFAKELNKRFGDADIQPWIDRFESEGRAIFDKRFEILDLLSLQPGGSVADIGAGSGLFSRLIAQRVGAAGIVYAVDISEPMVEHIRTTSADMELHNIRAILGSVRSPKLPADSVDTVLIADSYHHFEYPVEMLSEIKKALRPGGELLLIDFERMEGESAEFVLNMVRAGKETFRREFVEAGFEFVEEIDLFEAQYVLRFQVPTR